MLRREKLHEVPPGVSRARESRNLSNNVCLCSVGTYTVSQLWVTLWFIRYTPTHTDIPPGSLADQWYLMISCRQGRYFKIRKSQLHKQFDAYTWQKVLSGQCGEGQRSRNRRAQKERNIGNYFDVLSILLCVCTLQKEKNIMLIIIIILCSWYGARAKASTDLTVSAGFIWSVWSHLWHFSLHNTPIDCNWFTPE